MTTTVSTSFPQVHRESFRRALLVCGIAASLLYVMADLAASWTWNDYHYANQAISELSAIGAPTRSLWLAFTFAYGPLMFAFAWGAWLASGQQGSLRVVSGLLFGMSALGVVWGFFPMHLRGEPTSLTDTIHAVFAGVQVVLTLFAIGFSVPAFGKRFRTYAIASIAVMLVAGAVTFVYAPRLAAELPTPGIGLLERVNVYGYLLWIAMLAVALLRRRVRSAPSPR